MLKRTGFIALLVLVMALSSGGAMAKQSADHDGDADDSVATSYTEDDDTNDGGTPNNVADEGDNRHPSGKDRSVEHGKSGNQGRSESHPDDSKGPKRFEGALGADKPNGLGGSDLADQDGNNGCGNDDDFDDDNNGWCGKPSRGEEPGGEVGGEEVGGEEVGGEEVGGEQAGGQNQGGVPTQGPGPQVAALGGEILPAMVLGVRFTQPEVAVAGQVLPQTGTDFTGAIAAAAVLLMLGSVARSVSRRRSPASG